MFQVSFIQFKNWVPRSKSVPHRLVYRQTDTKVNTEDILSGFHFFFLLAFDATIKGKFWEQIVMSQGREAKNAGMSVARVQTDRHKSEYRGHPFRVSGIFSSTYHQGSVQ